MILLQTLGIIVIAIVSFYLLLSSFKGFWKYSLILLGLIYTGFLTVILSFHTSLLTSIYISHISLLFISFFIHKVKKPFD
jgi:hypothetical protein